MLACLALCANTKAAYAVHENALTGFTKESHNIGDLKPLVFVYFRAPRDSPAPEASGCPTSAARSFAKQSRKRPRWLSCRGHLTQTEGRADAETAGEGRPSRAIPIKPTVPPRDLQATSSTRLLKRRNRVSDAPRFVVARQRMHLYDNICATHKCWQYTVSLHKLFVAPPVDHYGII